MRRRSSDIAAAALVLAAVAASLLRLPELFRWKTRGAAYRDAREIDRRLPANEPVAVIGAGNEEDLFFGYYVYPRPTHPYRNVLEYRLDEHHPQTIVFVNDRARVMSYEDVRDALMSETISRPQWSGPMTRFIVPLAVSVDGTPPAVYTIEAWLRGESDIRITLWPQGLVKSVSVRGERSFHDFVFQNFQILGQGWLEIESDKPVEASFSFVNRGASRAASLVLLQREAADRLRVASGEKLWLLNTASAERTAEACGTEVVLAPHAIVSRAAAFPCEVKGAYAFGSHKEADGQTVFTWPEAEP